MRVFVAEIDGELYRRANEIPIFPHMTDVIENSVWWKVWGLYLRHQGR